MDGARWRAAIYGLAVGLTLGAGSDCAFQRYVREPQLELNAELKLENQKKSSLLEYKRLGEEYKASLLELQTQNRARIDELSDLQKNVDGFSKQYEDKILRSQQLNEDLLKVNAGLLKLTDQLRSEKKLLIDALEGKTQTLIDEVERLNQELKKAAPQKF